MNVYKLATFSVLAGCVFSANASAGEILEGAVMCMSQRHLERYEDFVEQEAYDFMNQMEQRAQCMVKKTPEEAIKLTSSGSFVKVQTLEGFKVWVSSDFFSEEAPASKKPQTVAE